MMMIKHFTVKSSVTIECVPLSTAKMLMMMKNDNKNNKE